MKTTNLRHLALALLIAGALSTVALAGWVHTPPKKQTIARLCALSNQLYIVLYDYYPEQGGTVPLTYPPGQTHYPCSVTVYKAQQVGGIFRGEVTPEGCFEDRPEDMIRRALNPLRIFSITNAGASIWTNITPRFLITNGSPTR